MLIKKDQDAIIGYLEDSSNLKGGYADAVIFPSDESELSAAIKDANSAKNPVTVSGGGTGTTGSRIPFGGLVVSTEKLNRIISVSREKRYAIVQSGTTVDDLKKASDKEGLFYTCHPTEGAATVGGTVATNASGARSFKYGPTRKYVNRLRMVMASGEIFEIKRGEVTLPDGKARIELPGGRMVEFVMPSYKMPDVKNAAGYYVKPGMDLIDIFIGQEGSLSVLTEIEMALVQKPEKILSCFVFFESEEDSWIFSSSIMKMKGILSIEYFDPNALNLLKLKTSNIPPAAVAAIFIEQETSRNDMDMLAERWIKIVSDCRGAIDDTWVAMKDSDITKFNEFRYAIPEAVNDIIRRRGFQKLSLDISVPERAFFEMMKMYKLVLKRSGLEHVIFGHIGEFHVHVNIIPSSAGQVDAAGSLVMEFIRKGVSLGGSVSAEHGIGKIKHKYLEEMYGRSGIMDMARLKKAFDPNCILGLGNMYPKEVLGEV